MRSKVADPTRVNGVGIADVVNKGTVDPDRGRKKKEPEPKPAPPKKVSPRKQLMRNDEGDFDLD